MASVQSSVPVEATSHEPETASPVDAKHTVEDQPDSAPRSGELSSTPPSSGASVKDDAGELTDTSRSAEHAANSGTTKVGSRQPAAPISPPAPSEDVASSSSASTLSYTPLDNPAARAGRGRASLLDPMRPCVFISLDERDGTMPEGKMQWVLDEPVTSWPTLTLRTVPEVLGDIVRVRLVLVRLVEDEKSRGFRADSHWLYLIESKADAHIPAWVKMPLCANPLLRYVDKGSGMGREVEQLPPLPEGVYELVAEVVGTTSEERTLAVTQFTVAAP